jgi:hypothetical protein
MDRGDNRVNIDALLRLFTCPGCGNPANKPPLFQCVKGLYTFWSICVLSLLLYTIDIYKLKQGGIFRRWCIKKMTLWNLRITEEKGGATHWWWLAAQLWLFFSFLFPLTAISGHVACSQCSVRCRGSCPTCRQRMTTERNFWMEEASTFITFPLQTGKVFPGVFFGGRRSSLVPEKQVIITLYWWTKLLPYSNIDCFFFVS